jgi:hypothetical protein
MKLTPNNDVNGESVVDYRCKNFGEITHNAFYATGKISGIEPRSQISTSVKMTKALSELLSSIYLVS